MSQQFRDCRMPSGESRARGGMKSRNFLKSLKMNEISSRRNRINI